MNGKTRRSEADIALSLIKAAFSDRPRPSSLTDSSQLTDSEYAEVMSFKGLDWQDVTFAHVVQSSDAVFWFSPKAFCYYLPGLLSAGLREMRSDTNAYDALVGTLDRSPEPAYWDDFFLSRWPLLSASEIEAVVAWVRWLARVEPDEVYENRYERVQNTLALLRLRAKAARSFE